MNHQLSKFIERNSGKEVWFGTRAGLFEGTITVIMDMDGVNIVELGGCKFLSSSNDAYIGRLTIYADEIIAWGSND